MGIEIQAGGGEGLKSLSKADGIAMLDAYKNITCDLEFEKATESIIAQACSIIGADRATLFHIDEDTEELIVKVAKGATLARIPRGKGFAGQVAVSGDILICDDVQSHPNFDPTSDKATGYTTKTLMTVPIKTAHRTLAVLQIVNKKPDGSLFQDRDKVLAMSLARMAGIVLVNAKTYQDAKSAEQRSTALMELVRAMNSNSALGTSLLFTLTRRTQELLCAERCDIYIADKEYTSLSCLSSGVKVPYSEGFIGACVAAGHCTNIGDVYASPLFDDDMKKVDGNKTKALLAAPVRVKGSAKATGALVLHNKVSDRSDTFDKEDELLLNDICSVLADHQDHLKELQTLSSANLTKELKLNASFPSELPDSPRLPVGLRSRARRGSLTASMAISEETEEEEWAEGAWCVEETEEEE